MSCESSVRADPAATGIAEQILNNFNFEVTFKCVYTFIIYSFK